MDSKLYEYSYNILIQYEKMRGGGVGSCTSSDGQTAQQGTSEAVCRTRGNIKVLTHIILSSLGTAIENHEIIADLSGRKVKLYQCRVLYFPE